jgi:hypothetical protein
VYASVRQLVVEIPVHRQLFAPLSALAVSTVLYLFLARWNAGIALAAACLLYGSGLIWSDGRRLFSFIRTTLRNQDVVSFQEGSGSS